MMTPDEMIAVIAARRDGKKIQFRRLPHYEWRDADDYIYPLEWNFHVYEYRIAPTAREPREWWITLNENGTIAGGIKYFLGGPTMKSIHVREVLTETGGADSQSAKR